MTISTPAAPLSYAGDGIVVDFAVTWVYVAKAHVVATLRDAAGVETVQVLDTDYSLTDPGDTGTLTMVVEPASGETLVITSEPPSTQETDIPLGGSFPARAVEDSLDVASQVSNKIENSFDRALRVPKTDLRSGSDLELPNETDRANRVLSFDADGRPTTSVAGTGDLLAANNLSDLDSASTARTNLGLGALAVLATVGPAEIDANAVETAKILDSNVTLAKIQDIATARFLGRVTAATGVVEELTEANAKTILALVKADVGLGNVDNTSNATERAATATLTNKTLTAPVVNSPTGIVKADVGLGNVDNTADTAKPVSTAQQTALDLKAPLASPAFTGTPTGITKTHVGLANVDNTADSGKSVLNATEWDGAVMTSSTSNPSGGNDGDIHFKYPA